MDEQRLAEIEARANAATPGPWRTEAAGIDSYIVSDTDLIFGGEHHEGYIDPEDPNAVFTAHAREDIPALVAEVRRLREVLAYYAASDTYAFGITVRNGQPVDVSPAILRDDCGYRAREALGIP